VAISDQFIKHFSDFVETYKQNGKTSFYHWTKEFNHSIVCGKLTDTLELVTSNRPSFHDASIIEYLNNTILLKTQTNPYLLACWVEFIKAYNESTKLFAPLERGLTQLRINSSEKLSASMIEDLETALSTNKQIRELEQKSSRSEIEMLKRQVDELQRENASLKTENYILKDQVDAQRLFVSLHSQIVTAETQLTSLTGLLKTLTEVTKQKPIPQSIVQTKEVGDRPVENSIPTPPSEGPHRVITEHTLNTSTKAEISITVSTSTNSEVVHTTELNNQIELPKSQTTVPTPPQMPPPTMQSLKKPTGILSEKSFFSELQEAIKSKQEKKSKPQTKKPQDESHGAEGEKKNHDITQVLPLSC
jgi:VPS inhibitor protein A